MSVEAERSLRAINRTKIAIGRSRMLAVPAGSAAEYRAEFNAIGVVQAFAVLDSYLTDRGDVLLHRDLPLPTAGNQLQQYVHGQVRRGFRGSIEGSVDFWSKAMGVALKKGAPQWDQVQDLRSLRNLIVHSLRSVRPHGEKLPSFIEQRLKKSGVTDPDSYIGQIPTTDKDFDDLAAWISDVITWVDKARP